ncbi:hypothetical protein TNCV_2719081 [Trichonephila clavipes]|nr:hypothetical protein TNCV_2719081 [Trichonephila clavipes]
MVLLETAVVAVDGLGTCLFCDVDVTFHGRPLFRSGATGEVFMSLTGVKAEVWNILYFQVERLDFKCPSCKSSGWRFEV